MESVARLSAVVLSGLAGGALVAGQQQPLPGKGTFEKAKPELEKLAGGNVNEHFRGRTTTTAKFSEPGEYILHMVANDYSGDGGGGEVCCWTTTMIKVTVTP